MARDPRDLERYVATDPGGEADELLEGESLEQAMAQVRHARLIGFEELGRVGLDPPVEPVDDGVGNVVLQDGNRVRGAHGAGSRRARAFAPSGRGDAER
jgi:hypothetical protein